MTPKTPRNNRRKLLVDALSLLQNISLGCAEQTIHDLAKKGIYEASIHALKTEIEEINRRQNGNPGNHHKTEYVTVTVKGTH